MRIRMTNRAMRPVKFNSPIINGLVINYARVTPGLITATRLMNYYYYRYVLGFGFSVSLLCCSRLGVGKFLAKFANILAPPGRITDAAS